MDCLNIRFNCIKRQFFFTYKEFNSHCFDTFRNIPNEDYNIITTSQLNNSIKSNWTLEQLRWKIYDDGDR